MTSAVSMDAATITPPTKEQEPPDAPHHQGAPSSPPPASSPSAPGAPRTPAPPSTPTGTGFVGKGDVQTALGYNNAQMQANAAKPQVHHLAGRAARR